MAASLIPEVDLEREEQIVSALGRQLPAEFGRGFDEKSLRHMIRFAETFSDFGIVSALRRELTWTHFKRLMCVDEPLKLTRKLHRVVQLARGALVETAATRPARQKARSSKP